VSFKAYRASPRQRHAASLFPPCLDQMAMVHHTYKPHDPSVLEYLTPSVTTNPTSHASPHSSHLSFVFVLLLCACIIPSDGVYGA
jgi:hypothetical protein